MKFILKKGVVSLSLIVFCLIEMRVAIGLSNSINQVNVQSTIPLQTWTVEFPETTVKSRLQIEKIYGIRFSKIGFQSYTMKWTNQNRRLVISMGDCTSQALIPSILTHLGKLSFHVLDDSGNLLEKIGSSLNNAEKSQLDWVSSGVVKIRQEEILKKLISHLPAGRLGFEKSLGGTQWRLHLLTPPALQNDQIESFKEDKETFKGNTLLHNSPVFVLNFTPTGTHMFAEWTAQQHGKDIGLVMDHQIVFYSLVDKPNKTGKYILVEDPREQDLFKLLTAFAGTPPLPLQPTLLSSQ